MSEYPDTKSCSICGQIFATDEAHSKWQSRALKYEQALREVVEFVEAWKAGDSELHAMAVIEATSRAALDKPDQM